VNAVIKQVTEGKGLTIILNKGAVVYGGVDITEAVLKKITGK
jgi:outer membrane protein